MFYLFNKTYLVPDINIEPTPNALLITPEISNVGTMPEDFNLRPLLFPNLMCEVASYDEALTQFGGRDGFFAHLFSCDPEVRTTIFASKDAYVQILATWLKTLLPNLTAEGFAKVWTMVGRRYQYLYGYYFSPVGVASLEQSRSFKAFGEQLMSCDLNELFNTTTGVTLTPDQRTMISRNCGVEFQLASYLHDTDWQHKDALEAKLQHFANSIAVANFVEVKREVLSQLHKLPGLDLTQQTLAEWVATRPQYAALVDTKVTFHNVDYVIQTYGDVLHDLYFDLYAMIGGTIDEQLIDDLNVMVLNPPLEEIVQMELNNKRRPVVLCAGRYGALINIYLVTYALASKDTDPGFLAQLSLP